MEQRTGEQQDTVAKVRWDRLTRCVDPVVALNSTLEFINLLAMKEWLFDPTHLRVDNIRND
jgi:hypothetical protein